MQILLFILSMRVLFLHQIIPDIAVKKPGLFHLNWSDRKTLILYCIVPLC